MCAITDKFRIDDVEMGKNPTSTFDKNGSPITYQRYFGETYGLTITDLEQPLLLHRAKPREQRARKQEGQTAKPEIEEIYLVPELCYLTGLSDEMKADFRVMKDIAVHTRITPGVREKRMLDFMNKLQTTAEVKRKMEQWGINFNPKLLEIKGRTLPVEKITMQRELAPYKASDAEW